MGQVCVKHLGSPDEEDLTSNFKELRGTIIILSPISSMLVGTKQVLNKSNESVEGLLLLQKAATSTDMLGASSQRVRVNQRRHEWNEGDKNGMAGIRQYRREMQCGKTFLK